MQDRPAGSRRGRERVVLGCGLACGVAGAVGCAWLVAHGSGGSSDPAWERRVAVQGVSAVGLALGALLVVLRRPVAARLVPLLAAGIALGLVAALVLAADLFMSYRALTRKLPGERMQDLHEPHPLIGWVPRPGGVGYHRLDGEFDVEYRIDGEGFRAVPHPRAPGRRLWLFGDSFTFGSGVSNEDTYASRIATAYLNDRVRVINAAVTGHGLVQMYARLLSLRERVEDGDVVVFAPISDDLERNLHDFVFVSQLLFRGHGRSMHYPSYEAGRLAPVEIEGVWNRLRALLFHAPLTEKLHRFVHRAVTASPRRTISEAREVIASARRLCAERGAAFLLVFLPRAKELRLGRYEVDLSSFDYVDIRSYFPRDPEEIAALRFPHDNHWSPRGHEIGAGALVAVLLERGLLGPNELREGVRLPAPADVSRRASGPTLGLGADWPGSRAPDPLEGIWWKIFRSS